MDHAAPFRTAPIHCPRCRSRELTNGDMRHCTTCKGSWVPEEVLHEHIVTMTSELPPAIEWKVSHARLGLPCAACKHAMEALLLFDIPVDRCHSHGVWFDAGELAEVLRRSTIKPPPARPPGDGSAGWMAAEVAAQGGIELAAEGTVAVAEVVADAGPGILEGVLDVLGGIFSAIDF